MDAQQDNGETPISLSQLKTLAGKVKTPTELKTLGRGRLFNLKTLEVVAQCLLYYCRSAYLLA